jgi:hypothetical protein
MSTHLYADVKPAVAGLDPNAAERVELVRAQKALESLAAELNVWPLTTFYSDDRASVMGKSDKESLAEASEAAELFDPTRGLDTIHALRDRLPALPDGADIHVEQALAELTNLEEILVAAQANQARFRLYPGP